MNSERFIFLDGIRGIAAIAVMLMHFTQNTETHLFTSAYGAVDLFFCLSGLVIAKNYVAKIQNERKLGEFLLRRLIRFYPTYLIGLVSGLVSVSLNIVLRHWYFPMHDFTTAAILNAFYIPYENGLTFQIGNGDNLLIGTIFPFNNPAWSLFYEVLVNFIFYATIINGFTSGVYRKREITYISVVVLTSLVLNGHAQGLGWGSGLKQFVYGNLRVISGFYTGYAIYTLPRLRQNHLAPLLTVGLLLIFSFPGEKIYYVVILILVPIAVYVGCYTKVSHLGNMLCAWLGDISYPVYCLHFPILLICNCFVDLKSSSGLYWVIALSAFVLIVSHVVYYYVDRPIRRVLMTRLVPRAINRTSKSEATVPS